MKLHRSACLAPFAPASFAGLILAAPAADAQTWLAFPADNIFHNSANWSTGTTPAGTTTVVQFGASSVTGINVNSRISLAAFQFNSTATSPYLFHFANVGSGASGHSLRGAGIVNNSAWAPTLVFDQATLNLFSGASLDDANVIFNGGTFNFTGLGGTATIQMNGGTLNHAHSGTTADGQDARLILNGGSLQAANPADLVAMRFGSIEGNGSIILNTTSTLTVGGNNRDATFSGTFTSAGSALEIPSVTKIGTGTWSLAGATNTANAAFTIQGGAVAIDANACLGNGALTLDGGTLRYAAAFDDLRALSLGAAGGTIDTQGFNVIHSTGIGGTGALVKLGSGSLTLAAASTYSGGTTLSAGTLVVGHDSALGTGEVLLAGGAIAASGTHTVANAVTVSAATTIKGSSALTFTGAWTLAGSHALTVANSATTRIAGSIGESGGPRALLKYGVGTLEITGANTYTGGTLLAEGTTRINNSTGSAFGTGAVTVAPGATLAGAGSFSGAFQNNGTYAPGNSPTLATLSSFSQGSTGVLEMELAGLARGTGYDALDISGSFTPGGTLRVLAIDDFSPSAGDSFDLFDFNPASISGTFATVDLPALAAGLTWDSSALYTTGVLSVAGSAIPEPAAFATLAGLAALGFTARRRS